MTGAGLMLAAWLVEAVFGYPKWLYLRIRHPVVWLGALVTALDGALNRPELGYAKRYGLGVLATAATVAAAVAAAVAAGIAIEILAPTSTLGLCAEAIVASSLLCSRSLYEHAADVAGPLASGDLAGARLSVSRIVGRDTSGMPPEGVAGAALESLAENTSDGIVAPLFWGVLFGLPGLAAYKAVNTLDSMIGHRNRRYLAFGGFAARLDDVANYVPARLTGMLFALASLRRAAFGVMWQDARRHRSPNAGWPESAAAGALNVRLSGPRRYGATVTDEPWLNAQGRRPDRSDLEAGLTLYCRAMALCAAVLAGIVIVTRIP